MDGWILTNGISTTALILLHCRPGHGQKDQSSLLHFFEVYLRSAAYGALIVGSL